MKLLHIISSAGIFGAENVLLNLNRVFQDNQITSYLICLKNFYRPDPEIHFEAKKQGFKSKVFICKNKFDIQTLFKIKHFIKKEEIQIIHSHGYKSNLYGLVASRLSRVPIIATLHGWTSDTSKVRLYERLDRWIIKKMDHLVCVSLSIKKKLEGLGLDNGRITFIPNVIDADKFDPDKAKDGLRQEFNLQDNPVMGIVGRLNYEKGHIYLLRAMKDICSRIPTAKLLIVGDGVLKEELKKEAEYLGISGNVIFTGIRKDMASVYKSLDIFILPSLTEGLPLALLEAMSMKLPVIATGVGGVPEVLSENEGILIPPKDAGILKRSILSLLADRALRKELGENARKKILSGFSLSSLFQKYMQIYSETMNNQYKNKTEFNFH